MKNLKMHLRQLAPFQRQLQMKNRQTTFDSDKQRNSDGLFRKHGTFSHSISPLTHTHTQRERNCQISIQIECQLDNKKISGDFLTYLNCSYLLNFFAASLKIRSIFVNLCFFSVLFEKEQADL